MARDETVSYTPKDAELSQKILEDSSMVDPATQEITDYVERVSTVGRGSNTVEALERLYEIQHAMYEVSDNHGFHDDFDQITEVTDHFIGERAEQIHDWLLGMFVSQKLQLTEDELSEAHEEVRSGNLRRGIYWKCKACGHEISHDEFVTRDLTRLPFSSWDGQTSPVYTCGEATSESLSSDPWCHGDIKPEGFGIELADAVIRALDLAEIVSIDLAYAIAVKWLYNMSRPYKHGRKF